MCMFLTMCPIRKFTVCFVMNFVQVLTTSGRLGIGTTVYYWPVTAKQGEVYHPDCSNANLNLNPNPDRNPTADPN